jgi:hypothetical protein
MELACSLIESGMIFILLLLCDLKMEALLKRGWWCGGILRLCCAINKDFEGYTNWK